jgi:hypothetical protein
VKHLDNKVIDGLNELRTGELCLERTTKANDDYKSQNAQLTRKIESNLPLSPKLWFMLDIFSLLTPLWLIESDVELNALKAMVENTFSFFYPSDSSTITQAPQMLDSLPTRSREIILTNMKQLASLTLRILKSLHPRANLEAAGEGFTATCNDEEALKLVEDSAVTVEHIIDMLPVDILALYVVVLKTL